MYQYAAIIVPASHDNELLPVVEYVEDSAKVGDIIKRVKFEAPWGDTYVYDGVIDSIIDTTPYVTVDHGWQGYFVSIAYFEPWAMGHRPEEPVDYNKYKNRSDAIKAARAFAAAVDMRCNV